MVAYFFDENISSKLVASLRSNKAPGSHLHPLAIGMKGLTDDVWIPMTVKNDWIAISVDRNEKTRGLTAQEIAAMGATYLMLGQFFDHMKAWDRAKWIYQHWDRIDAAAATWPRGSVWLIGKNGDLKQIA